MDAPVFLVAVAGGAALAIHVTVAAIRKGVLDEVGIWRDNFDVAAEHRFVWHGAVVAIEAETDEAGARGADAGRAGEEHPEVLEGGIGGAEVGIREAIVSLSGGEDELDGRRIKTAGAVSAEAVEGAVADFGLTISEADEGGIARGVGIGGGGVEDGEFGGGGDDPVVAGGGGLGREVGGSEGLELGVRFLGALVTCGAGPGAEAGSIGGGDVKLGDGAGGGAGDERGENAIAGTEVAGETIVEDGDASEAQGRDGGGVPVVEGGSDGGRVFVNNSDAYGDGLSGDGDRGGVGDVEQERGDIGAIYRIRLTWRAAGNGGGAPQLAGIGRETAGGGRALEGCAAAIVGGVPFPA